MSRHVILTAALAVSGCATTVEPPLGASVAANIALHTAPGPTPISSAPAGARLAAKLMPYAAGETSELSAPTTTDAAPEER